MTVAELYSEVAHLGFEETLEADVGFYPAANRALLQVAALRPDVRSFFLEHAPPESLLGSEALAARSVAEPVAFEAEGARAFSFEARGKGSARIELLRGEEWELVSFIEIASRDFSTFRGFIKEGAEFATGRVRLTVSSSYAVLIRNVAMYAFVYGDSVEDIPAARPFVAYDLARLCPGFLAFAAPPALISGGAASALSDAYLFEGSSTLSLPRERRGTYRILYRRRPDPLSPLPDPREDGTVITLDAELAALLPLLVAAYVWADYEPEKAQYYLALYRERAALLIAAERDLAPSAFKNVYGW